MFGIYIQNLDFPLNSQMTKNCSISYFIILMSNKANFAVHGPRSLAQRILWEQFIRQIQRFSKQNVQVRVFDTTTKGWLRLVTIPCVLVFAHKMADFLTNLA